MQKRLLLTALIASTIFAVPTALVATPALAVQCSDAAPESMERPGGFCDIRTRTETLALPVTSTAPAAEAPPPVAPGGGCAVLDPRKLLLHLPRGGRILSAC